MTIRSTNAARFFVLYQPARRMIIVGYDKIIEWISAVHLTVHARTRTTT